MWDNGEPSDLQLLQTEIQKRKNEPQDIWYDLEYLHKVK